MVWVSVEPNFHVDLGILGAQTCYLACFVDSLWRSGGPWDDHGTLRSTKHISLRSRLDFYYFFVHLRTHVDRFLNTLDQKRCILLCLFPRFFLYWFLGLNQYVHDGKIKHFAWGVLQKITFAEVGLFMISGSNFHDFGCPWDQFS